ncbi:hypothetical protein [Sporomusa sp.]|uniref:hypothetical protein n=1 Tax=Sporomusa sp. TaxID=2078658 RepID=UPI002C327F82|nr:hypothetical protein [Sporomusa sp.]HWR43235.1 hypothetical protein [Sporomusa sp.]
MCDIDRLFTHISEMDKTELAKAYLMALKENAELRCKLQKSTDRDLQTEAESTADTDI